jgi:hypothetical protein
MILELPKRNKLYLTLPKSGVFGGLLSVLQKFQHFSSMVL